MTDQQGPGSRISQHDDPSPVADQAREVRSRPIDGEGMRPEQGEPRTEAPAANWPEDPDAEAPRNSA